MKKTLALLATLCMGVAYAQVESETIYNESQPILQEKASELYPFEFGVSAGWGITAKGDDEPYVTDMGVINLEAAYYVMESVAFTFDFGFSFGGEDLEADFSGDFPSCGYDDYYGYYHGCDHNNEYDYNRFSFTFMTGFRSVIPVMPYTSVVLGAKGGIDVQSLSLNHTFGCEYEAFEHDQVEWSIGFAYALYGGLNFRISEQVSLDVTYQYRASTAAPSVEHFWEEGYPTVEAGELGFHEIRAGLRVRF